jgi:ATP-binding protein involved in chromosome partitioning
MKIAIPVEEGRLHENFGRCRRFTFLETDAGGEVVARSDDVSAPDGPSGLVPRWLHKQGVQVVIARGIGPRALGICGRFGIEVRGGLAEASVDEMIAAYQGGKLARVAYQPRPHDYPL